MLLQSAGSVCIGYKVSPQPARSACTGYKVVPQPARSVCTGYKVVPQPARSVCIGYKVVSRSSPADFNPDKSVQAQCSAELDGNHGRNYAGVQQLFRRYFFSEPSYEGKASGY
jgi:hypothetical protein